MAKCLKKKISVSLRSSYNRILAIPELIDFIAVMNERL